MPRAITDEMVAEIERRGKFVSTPEEYVDAAHKELLKRQKAEAKAVVPDNLPATTDRYRLYTSDLAKDGA